MNKDNLRPVSSIKHDDKRAAIPDSAHQGEEQMAINGQPEWSQYQVFRQMPKNPSFLYTQTACR